jgi:hypothetical protein
MNKEFDRMLKLAGLMTEGLYTSDKKAPMGRMMKLAGLMTEGLYTNQEAYEEPVSEAPVEKMTKEKLKAKIKELMLPEETIGQEAYAEMGSMDEYDTRGLTNAASVVDHYLKMAYDAGSTGAGFDDSLAYDMMDHLKQFSGEMGGMNEASYEGMERMDGLAPRSAIAAFVGGAERIILALKRDGFEDDDIHDYLIELITELPTTSEAMFEAKKDKESDTEDVIVADTTEEVPAEGAEVDVTADETKVDVNMDGVPDVDTGSAESKKAFTSLVDTYNSAKELGDPKLTQMIANALTYYNKNIILKVGQPQA